MAALLTNPTGVEVQIKFRWQGKNRYINNLYVPETASTTWLLNDVMNTIIDESGWVSELADAIHTACVIESITGRVRGRDDAGDTQTMTVEQVGLHAGGPTPSWLTFNVWQIPDNANRLVVSGTPSLFKRGRMAFPGVADTSIDGNTLDATAAARYVEAAQAMRSIPAGIGSFANPAFSLVMTRMEKLGPGPEFPPILRAKCNILAVQAGRVGTQLTAR